MQEKIKETYMNEGKSITQLIQEWVNENSSIIYCNKEVNDITDECT